MDGDFSSCITRSDVVGLLECGSVLQSNSSPFLGLGLALGLGLCGLEYITDFDLLINIEPDHLAIHNFNKIRNRW